MNRVELEYKILKRCLPECIPSVLDVGCGDGGMSLQFVLNRGTTQVHLLDGEEGNLGPKRLSYKDYASTPWRSTAKAARRISGTAPGVDIKTYTPDDPWPEHVDFIMSLWSWGFHYPIETYIDQVALIEAPLLIDMRNRRVPWSCHILATAGFKTMRVVAKSRKATRAIFTK